jgi:hypothetical protein
MMERIERFRNRVWCKAFTVENCNGKTCRHVWDNDSKLVFSKYFFKKLFWFF